MTKTKIIIAIGTVLLFFASLWFVKTLAEIKNGGRSW